MSTDSETARLIDRIRASTFYEAKQADPSFISIGWVSRHLKRSKAWVKRNWKRKPLDCFTDFSTAGRPLEFSVEAEDIIAASLRVQGNSCRKLAGEILAKQGERHSREAIRRFMKKKGLRPFHVIPKPLKTNLNRENRLFLGRIRQKLR